MSHKKELLWSKWVGPKPQASHPNSSTVTSPGPDNASCTPNAESNNPKQTVQGTAVGVRREVSGKSVSLVQD